MIQSEISQKNNEKVNHILMCVCGIEKNGTNEPICRAGIEIQVYVAMGVGWWGYELID